jgi:hypothetical protein
VLHRDVLLHVRGEVVRGVEFASVQFSVVATQRGERGAQ